MSYFALRASRFGLASFGLLCLSALSAQAQITIYNNDFSTGAGPEWSNNTVSTSAGENFLAPTASGFGLGNNTVTLTFSGLTPHSGGTINFDLYIINSWDGSLPGAVNGGGPGDRWGFTANGATLLNTSFANYTNGNTQDFQSQANPNAPGQNPRTGQFDTGHLGNGTGDFGDATYRFSYNFTDAMSSLSFVFTGSTNEPIGNEGWGLDNVSVSINPTAPPPAVPEPGSIALLVGMGATGAAFLRRRKLANKAV